MLRPHSPDLKSSKKPPPNPLKTTLNLFKTHISSHPKFWLIISFLCIQSLIIYFARKNDAVKPLTTNHSQQQQSHIEKICPSGKIYVYDLPSEFNKNLLLQNCTDLNPWNWQCGIIPNHGYGKIATELHQILPKNLQTSWYQTNQFSLELIFHHRILNHKCRTMEPESATAYYIPFYAGLAVGKTLWINDTAKRDLIPKKILSWITKQKYWKISNGSDHFMAIGRITWDFRRLTDPGQKWGSTFLNMPVMQNVTRLIIEKAPGVAQDIGVPYPTGLHPKNRANLEEWQNFVRNQQRTRLFSFIGATRNWLSKDFRGFLMNYCKNESPGFCNVVDCALTQCSTDMSVTLNVFLTSRFCLQPTGDSATRRSVFDCMLAGSVPVFFNKRTAYDQYEGFLPVEPDSYSVFIDEEGVRNGSLVIKDVLMRYGEEDVRRMREKVIETIPRLVYGGDGSFKDAFDVAVDGVMERIKEGNELNDVLL